MIYSDFKVLTGGRCTPEEYENINKIYMDCDCMSESDALELWNRSYGQAYKVSRISELIFKINTHKSSEEFLYLKSVFNKTLSADLSQWDDPISGFKWKIIKISNKIYGLYYLNHDDELVDTYYREFLLKSN